MSKTAEYRTEIRVPPTHVTTGQMHLRETPLMDILRIAVEKVVRDHSGRIAKSYRDNAGRRHRVLLALETQGCPFDIGFVLGREGNLEFRYDAAATSRPRAEALAREVSQNYAVIALMRALQRRGWAVSVEDRRLPSGEKVVHVFGYREGSYRVEATVDPQGILKADYLCPDPVGCIHEEVWVRAALQRQGLGIQVLRCGPRAPAPPSTPSATWRAQQ